MLAGATAERSPALYPPLLVAGLQSRRIPGLDGMRALGSFFVVGYHYGLPFIPGGWGVLNFLVLSGFLITWLLLAEEDRKGTIAVRSFYVRRMRHIVPAFLVFMVVVASALLVFGKRIVWPQVITAFLFVNNYYQGIFGDPNTAFSHTWALALNLQFYLLWPLLFVGLRRDRRRMAGALLVIIASIWAYRSLMWLGGAVPQGYVYEAFDMRADHLLLGCLVAVLLRTGSIAPIVAVATGRSWMPLLTMGLIGVSAVCEKQYGFDYRYTLGYIVNPILIMTLLLQVITFAATPMWRWFEWRWVRYLGMISYSVYLYQQVIVDPVKHRLDFLPAPLQVLGTLAAVYGISSVAYYLVEKPLRGGRKAALPQPQGAGAPTTASAPIDAMGPTAAMARPAPTPAMIPPTP